MPKKLSAKNKIILLVTTWLVLSVAMFLYFFKIFDNQNQSTINAIAKDNQNLVVLQGQDQSFKHSQEDLDQLASQPVQPQKFFSKDITFVNEIQTLENLSTQYNLQMQISGISGTVDSAPPATTATPMAMFPYTITLSGSLQSVESFIESMENLSFVTPINSVAISSAGNGKINANLNASFYLLK